MLLRRKDAGGASLIRVCGAPSLLESDAFMKNVSHRSVLERLHRAPLLAFSRCAFEAVVWSVRREESACMLAPLVKNARDDVSRTWCTNSGVLCRQYAHVQCHQEHRMCRSEAKAQQEA
ncbi:hypothetical protein ABL78_1830 [Leptomonas seymouri]|uniref:Uncharacterized protein n=1 Tax=Leptomonas seymouri TaxID=5684 RepID=A0A0N1I062_LEPSE|nr:hypothetical protein ABL78_1830 [Leptomonas seymouri]|eukprot:KPI89094.1 hypothetical protein ABL78_1830 [Leptomonas seymouri]